MEISSSLDQIQNSYRFGFSQSFVAVKIPTFEPKRRVCGFSFPQFRCSLLDQGLRSKPMPKPLKKSKEASKNNGICKSNFNSEICEQIENLVLGRRYNEALELFEILELAADCEVKYDTYDALVSACIGIRSIKVAKRLFNHMVNSNFDMDLYMMNRVLAMHVKCRMMIDAHKLFVEMPERNLASWNTIIGGFVDSGNYIDAFRLFFMVWKEDPDFVGPRTFTAMIRASAGLELIYPGKQLHCCALKMGVSDDVFVSCTLIDMYSKCGDIEDARFVFDMMPEKTTVGWNNIIAGYAFHGYSEEALAMYYEMQGSGVKLDHFTYTIIIQVCTKLGSLEHAKQAHTGLVRNGFGSDRVANTALIDFYCKWGRIEDAQNVFERMTWKNVVSWNSLIAGYGNRGRGVEAVELFKRMVSEGVMPTHVTFKAVLSACCYAGLSDIGWEIFESMNRDYKIKPRAMHYACMIELLGREGLLDEGLALIQDAPFEPTINMWAALLTACRVHKNFLLGKYAAEKLYGIRPEKLSNYVVLLNIYNREGKLEEAAAVLQTLKQKGLTMRPSCTWIEIKKEQHVFLTGDKSHPQMKEIYDNLDKINAEISKQGYVPQGKHLLPDVDEQEASMVLHHSEMLAISFGLISTPSLTPLQFFQGHRICDDCHNAIKLISMVCQREIVFRDVSRFHHFKGGKCSCGDYW